MSFITISEVPEAPFYVQARDRFLSGWGQSEGKDNWVLLPCKTAMEAAVVQKNAKSRSDMEEVCIVDNAKLVLRTDITVSLLHRSKSSRWYTPGGFE